MADDSRVLLNLVLNEATVQAVEGRIKNIVNRYNNTPINLNIRGTNLDSVISKLNTIQTQMHTLNNASVDINSSFSPSQQQYRLETERLRVSQLTELARQRTLQSENNALAQMAAQNRTLNIQNTVTHQIDQNVNNMGQHMQNAGHHAHDFVDYLAHGAAHIATYKTLQTIMYNVRDAFREAKDVDTSLISVKKTTGLSDEDIEAMRKSSYDVATEYGRTPSEYLKSVASFARAGYREQSTELGKISLLSQNVGELSSSEADEMLLAVDAAFQLKGEVGALTNVVNGLNNVANKNATDMGKLSEGLKVSASMAKTAGLEISDIVSLIAVGTATTQRSGSEIGRAVRSILMNTTALKGTLEDGEIIDDESISKTHKALEGVGVQVKEVKDGIEQLRNPMDILDDLAETWDSLSPDAQNILLSDMGQKRHANVLSGIIDNWDMAEKVMGEYFNSANSAVEENALYLQGWESKSAKVSTKWAEFVSNMVDTSLIKASLDTLYTGIDVLDSPLGRLVTQVVLLNTAFAVTGRLWTAVRARSIVADILSIGAANRQLGTAIQLVNEHLRERIRLWAMTPSGIATIGFAAISLITSAVNAYNQAVDEYKQKLKEAAQESAKQAEESANNVKALLELKTSLEGGTKSADELTTAFEEQLKAMGYTEAEIDTLIAKYGGLAGAIDESTRKALENARTTAHTDVATSSKSLEAEYDGSDDLIGQDSVITGLMRGMSGSGNAELDKQIREILNSKGFMYDPEYIKYRAKDNSAASIYEYYQGLQEIVQLMQQTASETNNSAILDSFLYNDVRDAVDQLSESANLYGDAISRLHSADAQLELADYLKTNSIGSKEAFDDYINGIKNSTEYSDEYKQVLIDIANNTFPQFSKQATDTGNSISDSFDKTTASLEDLKNASDGITTLSKAFKELSDDGYISIDTLTEIQKAVELTGTEWENYKQKLLGAKVGSKEFNEVMSDLTYEILNAKLKTGQLTDEEKKYVENLLKGNGVVNATEVAASAIEKLVTWENIFNNSEIKVEDKIKKLEEMAKAIGKPIAEMVVLNSLLSGGMGGKFNEDGSYTYTVKSSKPQDYADKEVTLTPADINKMIQDAYNAIWDEKEPTPEYTNPSSSSSSAPDKPEEVKTTPKERKRDNSYSDFFDEILSDRQKAREAFEEKDEQLQREFEQALEDLDLESAERISQAISDNETEFQRVLGEQLEQSQNALNGEILPAIFEIAPELKGKAWEDITEVDKEKIRQGLEQAKLDAENAIIDEENRIQAELDALETQWNQNSYNRKLANGNKEDEAYKQAEAEFKSKKDALEKDIDAITASDSPLQQALESAEKQIEAWDGLTNSAEDYAEDIKEIPGLINESQERIEQSSEDLKGGLDDLFSEYERYIDRTTKALEEQAEAYDILINKGQALVDGERKMYDAQASVREIQRDISKELRTNKAMAEYLDESTRKPLFNEDDYDKLDSKLKGISKDIGELGAWYNTQIANLTEDNWYLESAITAEYERRLESKQKEYEIARAELDLEKKKLELNNILNERNIRMLTKNNEGKYEWTYVHNTEEASRVVGEIADLEGQIAETRLQAEQDAILATKQAKVDQLSAEQAAINNQVDQINEHTEMLSQAIEDITDPLADFGTITRNLNSVLSSAVEAISKNVVAMGGSVTLLPLTGDIGDDVEFYSLYTVDKSTKSKKHSTKTKYHNGIQVVTSMADAMKDPNWTNVDRIFIDRDDIDSYDNGGIAKGKGFMFKDTNFDELVLDPKQTDYFKNFVKNMEGFNVVADNISNIVKNIPTPELVQRCAPCTTYSFNGDIILPNVAQPEDFMREFHKALQQNSFKKN